MFLKILHFLLCWIAASLVMTFTANLIVLCFTLGMVYLIPEDITIILYVTSLVGIFCGLILTLVEYKII